MKDKGPKMTNTGMKNPGMKNRYGIENFRDEEFRDEGFRDEEFMDEEFRNEESFKCLDNTHTYFFLATLTRYFITTDQCTILFT